MSSIPCGTPSRFRFSTTGTWDHLTKRFSARDRLRRRLEEVRDHAELVAHRASMAATRREAEKLRLLAKDEEVEDSKQIQTDLFVEDRVVA